MTLAGAADYPGCPAAAAAANNGRSAVRIGGASGFCGDTALAMPQLLADGELGFKAMDAGRASRTSA
ncbi:MAG: hypothetical protein H7Y61_11450 [Rhizobiales bacterium]|nr:hypothetical protein [Rhizobacter sp.]